MRSHHDGCVGLALLVDGLNGTLSQPQAFSQRPAAALWALSQVSYSHAQRLDADGAAQHQNDAYASSTGAISGLLNSNVPMPQVQECFRGLV